MSRPRLPRRCRGLGGEHSGLMGMHADREPHLVPGARHRARPRELGLVLGPENDQRACDARVLRPSDDGVEIGRELVAGQVAVRVDHRTRAPAGRLGSTATSDGGPVSVLAASTMPCDSMPIIGRGLRFATTTIVRPTSSSGL